VGTLKTEAPAYTDLSGLSKLKRAAGNNDPTAIRAVAQQFEAMFTRMMLKSMRDAVGTDPMFGSDQQQMYQGMADDQLSVQLAKGKGLGLADMLVRQLQKMGVKGADAAAGANSALSSSNAPAGGRIGTGASTGASTGANASGAADTAGRARGAKAAAAYSATERASATSTVSEAAKTSFVQDLWPHAKEAGQLLGVDPRHLIAQAALETNWGRNIPQDSAGRSSNNLFGIKAAADWSGSTVTSGTQEFQNGVATTTAAQFKAYATPVQSLQDYVSLLRNNPRYTGALNTGGDVQAFAAALQRGGYATDPDYANKVAAVANTVAHKVNPRLGAGDVSNLKLADSLPISASTGTL
jgi:peptidoglycan hydrolase FlgJ